MSPGKFRLSGNLAAQPGNDSKANSSVTSSPMNTACASKRRIRHQFAPLSPLLMPGRLTSNIALPSNNSVASPGNAARAAAM